jgi:hypothetical protein
MVGTAGTTFTVVVAASNTLDVALASTWNSIHTSHWDVFVVVIALNHLHASQAGGAVGYG